MNVLDWILLVLVGTYALSGYWQGFITGAFATLGLLAGGAMGIWLAPVLLGNTKPSLWVSLGALFIVIAGASIGQALLQFLGARIRAKVTWQPVRVIDAFGGALLSALASLVVAWALGLAVSGSRLGPVTEQVRSSAVLASVNEVMPGRIKDFVSGFDEVVGASLFPRYLEPFAPERIVEVDAGPARLLDDPDVVRTEEAVLKVYGTNRCKNGVEGTAFVYAPDRVMTSAHVVAGVRDPELVVGNSTVPATVVVYDPDLDIAVLAVDTPIQPLRFGGQAKPSAGVAIVGYPQDGPFDIQTARIRAEQRLRSPNIYGESTVVREVYSVRGKIRPGNSGGPLVSSRGRVLGMVFAASITDSETGYALTVDQLAETAAAGISASQRVSTGACAG